MRIVNNLTTKKVLFSRFSGFLYLGLTIFILYKCFLLLPLWLSVRDKAMQAQIDFERKVEEIKENTEEAQNKQTNLGKQRYQKDFFNKLDEGEHLIVLYSDNRDTSPIDLEEEPRQMSWLQTQEQNFSVWWKNWRFWASIKKFF